MYTFEKFFYELYVLCLCKNRLAEAILTNTQNVCFTKNNMGLSMTKHTGSADFCADQIDVITNFAVITNVVIKRAHCTLSNHKNTFELQWFEHH